jgi:hypothetical protein
MLRTTQCRAEEGHWFGLHFLLVNRVKVSQVTNDVGLDLVLPAFELGTRDTLLLLLAAELAAVDHHRLIRQ